MRRVNRWKAPKWFRWWMVGATRAGDGWLWGGAGAAVLCSGDPERYHALTAAAFAVTMGIGLFHSLKRKFRRTRPRDIEPHCWFFRSTRDRFSFPSGHSTTAFAVAITLGSFYPQLLPWLLLLALNVAVSRIIVGMHFVTDVLAGAAMGAGLSYLAMWLVG